jgi:hypothetical protein
MKVIKTSTSLWVVAMISVLVGEGCQGEPKANTITLSKYGGGVTLRLKVKKGDSCTYEYSRTAHIEDYFGNYDLKESYLKKFDVDQSSLDKTRVLWTESNYEIDTKEPRANRKYKHAHRIFESGPIESIYNEYAASLSRLAVSTNEDIQRAVAENRAFYPAMGDVIFPKDRVSIGAQWWSTVDLSPIADRQLFGNLFRENQPWIAGIQFKLVGAEEIDGHNLAVIEYTINADLWKDYQKNPSQTFIGEMSKEMSLTYNGKGVVRIDIDSGVMYKATQSQQINERTFGNAFAESSTSTTKVFRKANSGLFEKH